MTSLTLKVVSNVVVKRKYSLKNVRYEINPRIVRKYFLVTVANEPLHCIALSIQNFVIYC